MDTYRLEYIVANEAWCGKIPGVMRTDVTDTVLIANRNVSGGGVAWEAAFRWYPLGGGRERPSPCLEVFCSAWAAPELHAVLDQIAKIASTYVPGRNARPATVAEVRAALEAAGFVDATERVRRE